VTLYSDQASEVLLSEEARSLYQHAPSTVEMLDLIMMRTEILERLPMVPQPKGLATIRSTLA